jgi:hypothetical protein
MERLLAAVVCGLAGMLLGVAGNLATNRITRAVNDERRAAGLPLARCTPPMLHLRLPLWGLIAGAVSPPGRLEIALVIAAAYWTVDLAWTLGGELVERRRTRAEVLRRERRP